MIERAEANTTPLLLTVGLGGLIAVSLLLQPPFQGAIVFVAVGAFVLAFFNRRIALYVIVPAMALSPDLPVLGIPVRAEDLLMIALAAGWLAHLCVSKDRQRTSLDNLLVAYFLVGLVATLWGGFQGSVNLFTTDKGLSAPFHLLKRLEFVLLFFIIADTLRTPGEARGFAYGLIASMTVFNIYSLVNYRLNRIAAVGPLGISGFHEAGVASMIAVPFAISLIPACKLPVRFLVGAVLALSLLVLPLTLGRSFIAITVLILLYVGLFRQRWVLLVPALMFLGLSLYPSNVTNRIITLQHVLKQDFVAEYEDEVGVRFRTAPPLKFATEALAYSPILGFGMASVSLGEIDSEYGSQLYYTGLVGLGILLLLGLRALRMATEVAAAARDPVDAALARGCQLALMGYAAYSVFGASVSTTHIGGFFFAIVGLIAVLHRSLASPLLPAPPHRAAAPGADS